MKYCLALACVVLAACGSSSTQSLPPVPAQPVKHADIAFYGDSTIYGYTWSNATAAYVQADPTAPQTAGTLLATPVDNRGIGGTDTAAWLTATEGAPTTWAQEMSAQKSPIVVLQWGINDALRAMPISQFSANLAAMIVQAQNAGKTVYLETANPIASTDLSQYAAAVRALAVTHNVTVIDEFAQLSADPSWPSMLSDGTHPTQAGYDLKGQIEAKVLQ